MTRERRHATAPSAGARPRASARQGLGRHRAIPFLMAALLLAAPPAHVPAQGPGAPRHADLHEFGEGSPEREALAAVVLQLDERQSAMERVNRAGQLLAKRELEAAALHYLMVLAAEPHNDIAAYNLACAFALGGKVDLGIRYLDRAVENGFWGWDLMRVDHDLDNLRDDPRFADILADVERRYRDEEPRRTGRSLLLLPEGDAPADGWPLFVFLPGWGLNHESFRDVAVALARQGHAVHIPAPPIVMAQFMHRWDVDDLEGAADYVARLVARDTRGVPVRAGRPLIGGFSQGAYVATRIAAAHPDAFAGVLAIVPAGGVDVAAPEGAGPGSLPLVVMTGDEDDPLHHDLAREIEVAWRARRQPVDVRSYPVGHRLPPNWGAEIVEALAWIDGAAAPPPAD